MASRDIGNSIQAALHDLFRERDVVQEAIDKLQSLLDEVKETVQGKRRGRPPGSKNKKKTKVAKTSASATRGRPRKKAGRKKKA